MIVSWSSFIYALTHHLVLDASLGYFINPLFVIALGCIFLKEKLSLFQAIAVFSGVCGLTFQIIMLRHFPALALTMGLSFALYGLARKFIHYDVMTSITIETLWALPVSLLIFLFSDTGPIISANTPFFFVCHDGASDDHSTGIICHRVKSHLVDCHRTGAIYRAVFTVLTCHYDIWRAH